MYFLWQRTPYGTLRISYGGICDFVKGFMNSKVILHGVALNSSEKDSDADLTMLASSLLDNDISYEDIEKNFERHATALMRPIGIRPNIIWFNRGAPGTEWLETRWSFFSSPWVWLAIASSIALVVSSGWDALFWTAFWGTSAWFISRSIKFLTKESVQGRRIFSVPKNPPTVESLNAANIKRIKSGGESH